MAAGRWYRGLWAVCLLAIALASGATYAQALPRHAEGRAVQANAPDPRPGQVGGYSKSLFKFSTVIPDNGEGVGGGSQQASVTLHFVHGRQEPVMSWSCSIKVDIPLRTETFGKVSAERAAQITAKVATEASTLTMHSKSRWVAGMFCQTFKETMLTLFREDYKGLGARVQLQT